MLNVSGLDGGKTLKERIDYAARMGEKFGLRGENVTNWEIYTLKRNGLPNGVQFYENGAPAQNPGW